MKRDIKKIIGITTVVSSVALEIITFVSALSMRKYSAKYRKYLNEYEDNKNRLTKSRIRTIALGTTAVALAIVGVKINAKKDIEEVAEEADYTKEFPENNETVNLVADIKQEVSEEPKEEVIEKTVKVSDKWKCAECGHENDGEKKVCSYCGSLRADILNQALQSW